VFGHFARAPIGALLLAALLGGCAIAPAGNNSSGGSLPLVRALSLPQSLMPSGGQNIVLFDRWLYTAQFYGEDLNVYRRQRLSIRFFETLRNGVSAPQGTVATKNGLWYIANGGHSNILIYRSSERGPTGPIATLEDTGAFPTNVGVTPSRRIVAVSNYTTVSGGAGSVSIYLNGHAEPARILHYGKDRIEGSGVAIDRRENCFWSFNDPATHSGSIVEFAGCKAKGSVVVPTIVSAGGIAFDQHGNLYYVDRTAGIYKCKRTSQCALFATGFGLPVNINFDARHTHLWVADASGYIDAVDPATGRIVSHTAAEGGSTDPPYGIAPAPGV
jgi:hypothetical protein